MAVDVAVEAGHARGLAAAILRSSVGLNSSCGKRRQQHPQAVELHRGEDVLEQAVVVVDRDHLAARDIAQFRPVLQEYRRRKLGQERIGQIEIDIETLQPGKHVDLHLGENLAAGGLLRMGQRWIGKHVFRLDFFRGHARHLLPGHAFRQPRRRPDRQRLAPGHLRIGDELWLSSCIAVSSSCRWVFITFGFSATSALYTSSNVVIGFLAFSGSR